LLSDGSADVDVEFHRRDRFGAGQEDPIAWVTGLRAPAIKKLAADGGPLQMTLSGQQDLTEIARQGLPRRAAGRLPNSPGSSPRSRGPGGLPSGGTSRRSR
jgi:hypothetical protein